MKITYSANSSGWINPRAQIRNWLTLVSHDPTSHWTTQLLSPTLLDSVLSLQREVCTSKTPSFGWEGSPSGDDSLSFMTIEED